MNKFIELLQRNFLIAPLIALVLVLIGLAIGLGIGWMTVDFRSGADDVVAAADAFATNNDPAFAKRFLKSLSTAELTRHLNDLYRARVAGNRPLEADRIKKLGEALGVNVTGGPTAGVTPVGTLPATSSRPPGSTPPAPSSSVLGIDPLILIFGALLLVLLVSIAAVIFIRKILPNLQSSRVQGESALPTATERVTRRPHLIRDFPARQAPTTTAGGLGRFVPQYVLGNDNYDTSYSLETPRGEFLGECGMGISETIGEGKPDKVTAFDVWLFDKADVRTVTKILMSDFAFNDQTLRTKLATKGEAFLAEKGKTLRLDTQSLSIDVHIVELVYANNASYPPNSHLQKLIVEIVPTQKSGAAAR